MTALAFRRSAVILTSTRESAQPIGAYQDRTLHFSINDLNVRYVTHLQFILCDRPPTGSLHVNRHV